MGLLECRTGAFLSVHGNVASSPGLEKVLERSAPMSENAPGSFTLEAADLRSPDLIVRERAALQIWERFEPRFLDLVRHRLNPRIRVRDHEHDMVQSLFKSFFAADRAGDCPPTSDRDALWRLLVRMAMCTVAKTAHQHQALRRDVQRELHPTAPRELSDPTLARWMAGFEGRRSLLPEEAAVVRDEFERLLRNLPEPLQQIFMWKLADHSNAQIGRRINRTERTVELKIRIIRKTLEHGAGTRTATQCG